MLVLIWIHAKELIFDSAIYGDSKGKPSSTPYLAGTLSQGKGYKHYIYIDQNLL